MELRSWHVNILHNYLYPFFRHLTTLLVLCLLVTYQLASAAVSIPADFNGDGYEDLAVGVPGENVGSIVDAGAVHVFMGPQSVFKVIIRYGT